MTIKIIKVVVLIVLLAFIFVGLGIDFGIEKACYKWGANSRIKDISFDKFENKSVEQFDYSDGKVIIMYGQSHWSGHGVWNYNLAKTTDDIFLVSEEHFCVSIKTTYENFKKNNSNDEKFQLYEKFIGAKSLSDAKAILGEMKFKEINMQ